MQNNRNELYTLSNQMIDIFIKDTFSKNKVNLEKVKTEISDEQREALKQSVIQLQGQVESFIHDKNASKTVTENGQTNSDESISPLRLKLAGKETGIPTGDQEDKEE